MDTPQGTQALDPSSAASAIASVIFAEPPKEEKHEAAAEPEAQTEAQTETPTETTEAEATAESAETATEDDGAITVEIDGKPVTLTKEQISEAYKSGLRQADYTRKTMEVAETRKAAQAEAEKAKAERGEYAKKLQDVRTQLEASLTVQQKDVDWDKLLQSDPIEFLRQKHQAETWQANLQHVLSEQQRVTAQEKAEADQALRAHIETQQQELLAKLPEWKDEAKAKAEKTALREYLTNSGYSKEAIASIQNARDVEIAIKAMRYDQLMTKAQVAAKKVATLPTKVVKPGTGAAPALDKRTAQFQKLSKSGRAEDAASLFASIL